MSVSLGANFSSWGATVSANPESLTVALSATNVEHALRTAVTRTPQKTLLTALLPHIALCLQNPTATTILSALVRFATPKSVGQVCTAIAPHMGDIKASLSTSSEIAVLLEAIVARSDDNSASRKEIVKAICALPIAEALANPKFLLVAASLVVVEPSFGAKLTKSKEALKAISAYLTSETKSKEAIRFVEQTLASVEDKPAMCKWVLQAMKASDPAARHRSEIVAAIAENGDSATCEVLSKAMIAWPSIHVKSAVGAKALTKLLTMVTPPTGEALARKIIETTPVQEFVSDRGTAMAGLGLVLGQRFATLLSGDDAARLVALKVRIDAATKPKNISTKDIILEKIRQFEESQKRPRAV